jgi:predicted regulator of Ras-like GTPase activity (Roadblock/LC7/MglB family)
MAMVIPFLNLVKKAKEKFEARKRSPTIAPLPSVEDKPEADKLAKRVTPYAVRTMTPEPSGPALAAASTMAGKRISLNRAAPGSPQDLGPSVVVAVEPRGERTVSLALSDVIAAMPQGYLKTNESFDTSRRVTLKAVEVEKGLATGRPSIPIAAIYQQVPEIFEHTVVPSDTTAVLLPVQKVIDELSQLRVREDQTTESVSAQVETPFLKLMVEESAKFGTTVAPFETTELLLPVEPAAQAGLVTETARVESVRPPPVTPPVARPSAGPPVTPQAQPVQPVQPAPAARVPLTTPRTIPPQQNGIEPSRDDATPRIPLVKPTAQPEKTLPIGTGGPAFPRVPASSGSPVPPAVSPPTATPPVAPPSVAPPIAGPTRIPFQLPEDAPPEVAAEQPKPTPSSPARVPLSVPGPAASKAVPVAATPSQATGQPVVTLPLRPILQSLPPMQVAGDVESVPAEAKISFQISAIAPQLASGKVVIPPKDFHAALPEQYRALFLPDAVEAPVQLSLPDVLANLPGDSLRMRDDQEVFAQDEIFETPFLAKAKEDAERFTQSPEVTRPAAPRPVAEAPKVETPKAELPTGVKAEAPKVTVSALPKVEPPKVEAPRVQAPASVNHLDISIMPTTAALARAAKPAEEGPKFDAKAAIAQACALAGVSSCSVIFTDGLIIAGNIPDDMHMEGLSAVAPTMLKKLEKHMCETQLGPLTCLTVHGEKSPVTFFSAGNLCLTAVHNGTELSAESRRELSRITQELSRTYPQLETAHVNH